MLGPRGKGADRDAFCDRQFPRRSAQDGLPHEWLRWRQCYRLSECEIVWRLSHYASFSSALPHLSFLTSFLTAGNAPGCLSTQVGGRKGELLLAGRSEWREVQ